MGTRRSKQPLRISFGPGCPADFVELKQSQPDGQVDEFRFANTFHTIPGKDRGKFMDGVWRQLKVGGKATFIVPYWSSMRAIADFACEWPPVNEVSFAFFNRAQREANKVHPELKCDFDIVGYGYNADAEVQTRPQETQAFWNKHYVNSVLELQIVLVKRP